MKSSVVSPQSSLGGPKMSSPPSCWVVKMSSVVVINFRCESSVIGCCVTSRQKTSDPVMPVTKIHKIVLLQTNYLTTFSVFCQTCLSCTKSNSSWAMSCNIDLSCLSLFFHLKECALASFMNYRTHDCTRVPLYNTATTNRTTLVF